ncbi:MAG TPA: DMT family transporter [Dehalococcoidia bacterium]|nr:DMT family transporter [Dehalococcoidia bacterium]
MGQTAPAPPLCRAGLRIEVLRIVAIGFALSAAVAWALSAISVRLGLRYMPATLGTFISLCCGLVLMLVVVGLFQRSQIGDVTLSVAGIFALVGLFNFIFGRYLNFLSISHLGVVRATPIASTTPLFAAVLAVIFLGESIDALTIIGTLFVMSGIYLVLKQT